MFRVVSGGAQRSPVKKKKRCVHAYAINLNLCDPSSRIFIQLLTVSLFSVAGERKAENINEPRRNECKIRDLDKRRARERTSEPKILAEFTEILFRFRRAIRKLASHVILQLNGGVRLLGETYPASALALDPQRRLGI